MNKIFSPCHKQGENIVVRPTGFEPAAYRVGVIRPSSRKALRRKGLVGIAQISAILEKKPRKPCLARLPRFFAIVVK